MKGKYDDAPLWIIRFDIVAWVVAFLSEDTQQRRMQTHTNTLNMFVWSQPWAAIKHNHRRVNVYTPIRLALARASFRSTPNWGEREEDGGKDGAREQESAERDGKGGRTWHHWCQPQLPGDGQWITEMRSHNKCQAFAKSCKNGCIPWRTHGLERGEPGVCQAPWRISAVCMRVCVCLGVALGQKPCHST